MNTHAWAKLGFLAVLMVLLNTPAHSSKLAQFRSSLENKTYRFGLKSFTPTIAYFTRSGAVYYVSGSRNPRIVVGKWRVVSRGKKLAVCIWSDVALRKTFLRPNCYPARRFKSFLKTWEGNPLGLRPGGRLKGNIGVRPSFTAVKNALR